MRVTLQQLLGVTEFGHSTVWHPVAASCSEPAPGRSGRRTYRGFVNAGYIALAHTVVFMSWASAARRGTARRVLEGRVYAPEDGDAEDHPNMYVVDSSGRLTVEEIANVRKVPADKR